MDGVQEITQVISSVGFPIVACGALFWMINTTMAKLTDAITELTKSLDKANEMQEEGAHFG
jgi:hypothetical protein